MDLKADYRGELAQRARLFLNRTQKEMAAMFGLSLRAWQDKEQNTNRVSVSETYMLLLLLNEHPDYQLLPRIDHAKTSNQALDVAVKERKRERWIAENRAGIEALNSFVAEAGIFSDDENFGVI